MDRRGKLGAADEQPLGCAQIDEHEIAGGQRIAVQLVCVDAHIAALRDPAASSRIASPFVAAPDRQLNR